MFSCQDQKGPVSYCYLPVDNGSRISYNNIIVPLNGVKMATATKKKTAPATKTRVTKKQVIAHRTRASKDFSPVWDGASEWTGDQFTKHFRTSMEYYRLESSVKDLRPKVAEWMESAGYKKDVIGEFRKLKDSRVNSTLCAVAACLVRGMPAVHEGFNQGRDTGAWLRTEIEKSIQAGKDDAEEVATEKDVPAVKKETIQDRLAEKFSETMGEIEGAIDDFVTSGKEVKAFNILSTANVAVQYAPKVVDIIQRRVAEMNELLEGKDGQLLEAYKHLSKRDVKAHIKMYETIINDAMAYKTSKIATRAKPKRKPVPPERQVKGLKFLKEFAELGLKSVNPTEILGMSELWTYNTKTRKLGRFVVAMHGDMVVGQLGVKGSAIIGFDEIKSTCKTLRKPAEQLATFKTQGKPGLRKFMDTIKAVETRLKGRISPETILLRAIK